MKRLEGLFIAFRTRRIAIPHAMLAVLCMPMVMLPPGLPASSTYAASILQDSRPQDVPTIQEADALLATNDVAAARDAYSKITEADPDNGNAWYQLGYCQLVMGDNAESIDSFAHAIKYRVNAPAAAYNIACAYAKDNKIDKGFAWLNKSIEFGFDQFDLIVTDPDLENLRSDPRFGKLPKPIFNPRPESGRAVQFYAPDGVKIYGDLYAIDAPKSAPMILLFHQGGSNKSEYYPIAPKLNEIGFHCLAIDARSGGARFGHENETVNGFDGASTMLDAYVDLEAAIKFARTDGFTGKLIAWGSSYSSGLVLKLAMNYPDDVTATLSFSIPPPRHEVMGGDAYAPDDWANASKAAMFLTLPPNEMNEIKQSFFDSIEKTDKTLFAQATGVHGSSTLHETRNADGYEANWAGVIAFLEKYSK